jgi:hypothetical protein
MSDPFVGSFVRMSPIEIVRPTFGLRFLNGRLQQMYEVSRIESSGETVGCEWRDVPSVNLADATSKFPPQEG